MRIFLETTLGLHSSQGNVELKKYDDYVVLMFACVEFIRLDSVGNLEIDIVVR